MNRKQTAKKDPFPADTMRRMTEADVVLAVRQGDDKILVLKDRTGPTPRTVDLEEAVKLVERSCA